MKLYIYSFAILVLTTVACRKATMDETKPTNTTESRLDTEQLSNDVNETEMIYDVPVRRIGIIISKIPTNELFDSFAHPTDIDNKFQSALIAELNMLILKEIELRYLDKSQRNIILPHKQSKRKIWLGYNGPAFMHLGNHIDAIIYKHRKSIDP